MIAKLQKMMKDKQLSSVELTKRYLDEIEKKESLNAFLYVERDFALAQAREADQRRKKGEKGPLLGIPYAAKDNLVVAGQPTTAGSAILAGYVGTYDATVISKLKKAGAVLLGKTNLDEFAMGSSTENSAYGRVHHPENPDLVPGGSSGGSAVAVAAGMAAFSLGSDTGGSIRQPAAFTGCVGMKPTYGAVSRYGLIAMASSLDQVGPFGRTVDDVRTVMEAISGRGPLDSTSTEAPRTRREEKRSLRGVILGVPRNLLAKNMDREVGKAFEESLKTFTLLGAKVKDIKLEYSEAALAVYYIIMPVEAASNLARYDGIRYGQSRDSFGLETKRRIMLGTYASAAGYYEAYYGRAQRVRTLVIRAFDKAFERVGAIVLPTTPTPPFRAGEKTKDPLDMYLSDIFTVPANIAGLPAISIPSHERAAGLPLGIQIIAPAFSEERIFNIAEAYEGAI